MSFEFPFAAAIGSFWCCSVNMGHEITIVERHKARWYKPSWFGVPGKAGVREMSPKANPLINSSSEDKGSYPGNLGTTTQGHHIQERENSATERRDTVLVTYITNNENVENKEGKKDWMQQNFFVIRLKAEL